MKKVGMRKSRLFFSLTTELLWLSKLLRNCLYGNTLNFSCILVLTFPITIMLLWTVHVYMVVKTCLTKSKTLKSESPFSFFNTPFKTIEINPN